MSEDTIFKLIGDVGFPIVVTLYLLLRMEKHVKHLDDRLKEVLSQLRKNGRIE